MWGRWGSGFEVLELDLDKRYTKLILPRGNVILKRSWAWFSKELGIFAANSDDQ